MASNVLGILIGGALLSIAIFLANKRNQRFMQENPDNTSYAWGYFFALFLIFGTVVFPASYYYLTSLYSLEISPFFNGIDEIFLGSIIMVPIAIGIYRRTQLGWVAYMVLVSLNFVIGLYDVEFSTSKLNIIFDAYNFFYLINRWDELKPIRARMNTTINPIRWLSS